MPKQAPNSDSDYLSPQHIDPYLLGVDSGGTFTDFVLISGNEIRTHKVLSTPEAPEQAILTGIADLGLSHKKSQLRLIHGTTVATNAALESKGVKTVFITNRGFSDLLSIGRQAREQLYNLRPKISGVPVPSELCLATGGRCDANGQEIEPLTEADLDQLEQQVRKLKPQAVAINLLFSFLNDENERRIEQRLTSLAYVCRSSAVLPEMREYERGIATWYNAYLGPLVANYFKRLQVALSPARLSIMQSSGGTIAIDQAADKAVNLLLSGPAGGLAAGAFIGQLKQSARMLSFDMGGTSTDVAMIDGAIKLTSEGRIGRYPVAVPMVDMHTIGAGGGSIAYLDEGGMLHVGPESAGAKPGPACYGKGGTAPTVTDANVVLGRLQPDSFLGGAMNLDTCKAQDAVAVLAQQMNLGIEDCAAGIIDLANEHMTQALRVISEQRGHDPADYQLIGFGGAGGLHICALADCIGVKRAMVPIYAGVFSAFGMLVAPPSRQLSQSYLSSLKCSLEQEISARFDQMSTTAMCELESEGISGSEIRLKKSVDCRYRGQSSALNIDWNDKGQVEQAFHSAHRSSYGHNFDLDVEIVNLRLSASSTSAPPQLRSLDPITSPKKPDMRLVWVKTPDGISEQLMLPVYQREQIPLEIWIDGPALICETSATTWIDLGWQFKRDQYGNLNLQKRP